MYNILTECSKLSAGQKPTDWILRVERVIKHFQYQKVKNQSLDLARD